MNERQDENRILKLDDDHVTINTGRKTAKHKERYVVMKYFVKRVT